MKPTYRQSLKKVLTREKNLQAKNRKGKNEAEGLKGSLYAGKWNLELFGRKGPAINGLQCAALLLLRGRNNRAIFSHLGLYSSGDLDRFENGN
jgi:hypothetical protein